MVILCQECHDKVDRDQIIINGWVETSAGIKFDYHIKTEKPVSKTKYSEELINFIKSLKKKVKSDEKIAKLKIKEKFDKNITAKSIINIWTDC